MLFLVVFSCKFTVNPLKRGPSRGYLGLGPTRTRFRAGFRVSVKRRRRRAAQSSRPRHSMAPQQHSSSLPSTLPTS